MLQGVRRLCSAAISRGFRRSLPRAFHQRWNISSSKPIAAQSFMDSRRAYAKQADVMPTLTKQQVLNATKASLNALQSEILANHLSQIRAAPADAMEKWTAMMGVMLQSQMGLLVQLGYKADIESLQHYNGQFLKFLAEDEEGGLLREVNDDRWNFVLKQTFGFGTGRSMVVEEARQIQSDMTRSLTQDAFVEKLKEKCQTLEAMPAEQRMAHLGQIIVPAQKEVLAKYGYEGDMGFIQAQKELMDHSSDPVVFSSVSTLANTLMKVAQIQ